MANSSQLGVENRWNVPRSHGTGAIAPVFGRNPKKRRSRYNRKLFFGKRFTSTNRAAERAVSIELVRTRHERQSDTIVAIFVFSYFRAFVIDSISSHHNSFHDKRRGVEDRFQKARPESLVNGDGRLDDPRGKRLEVMAHGSSSRQITKTRKYENTKKSRTGTLPFLGCQRPAGNAAFWEWARAPVRRPRLHLARRALVVAKAERR